MYYRLGYEYPVDEDGGYYMIEDGVDFDGVHSWALGQPFTATLPNPIELDLVPVSGFKGEPPDMFDGYMCLMSQLMIDAIVATGADNIDTYPAKLTDHKNGRQFDYRAVNIIGLIAAADLPKSQWENLDGEPRLDTHFTELVVDPAKTRGLGIFRMAEDTVSIIVHERLKAALQARDFKSLTYANVIK